MGERRTCSTCGEGFHLEQRGWGGRQVVVFFGADGKAAERCRCGNWLSEDSTQADRPKRRPEIVPAGAKGQR